MNIEVEGDKAWIFDIRSCGELPDAPLYLLAISSCWLFSSISRKSRAFWMVRVDGVAKACSEFTTNEQCVVRNQEGLRLPVRYRAQYALKVVGSVHLHQLQDHPQLPGGALQHLGNAWVIEGPPPGERPLG